jgi:uracil-DNA glycosylase
MRPGAHFTGDYAGILLYQTLYEFGGPPRRSPLRQTTACARGCRISNSSSAFRQATSRCPQKLRTCNRYLARGTADIADGTVLLALGAIAHGAVMRAMGLRQAAHKFRPRRRTA